MATKVFCDKCGEEGANNQFVYLEHLEDAADGVINLAGYVDNQGNHVSMSYVSVDLCNACYNKVVLPAVIALRRPDIKVDSKSHQ